MLDLALGLISFFPSILRYYACSLMGRVFFGVRPLDAYIYIFSSILFFRGSARWCWSCLKSFLSKLITFEWSLEFRSFNPLICYSKWLIFIAWCLGLKLKQSGWNQFFVEKVSSSNIIPILSWCFSIFSLHFLHLLRSDRAYYTHRYYLRSPIY